MRMGKDCVGERDSQGANKGDRKREIARKLTRESEIARELTRRERDIARELMKEKDSEGKQARDKMQYRTRKDTSGKNQAL